MPDLLDASNSDIFHDLAETFRKTVIENRYIPITPTLPQAEFLCCYEREAMYGGAAGGGKSAAMLAAALQFIHVPNYRAILLRRTFSDLMLPEALIPLSHEWLGNTDAKWSSKYNSWKFPSGSSLQFGYLETKTDRYRYQGAAFQFIGFDELTQFPFADYRYLFSRMRRKTGMTVPLRMRGATNPGGIGHDWVKSRFVIPPSMHRPFFSAKLEDNPHLDKEEYENALAELDPVTRAQLRAGDWEIRPEGNLFKRDWFKIAERIDIPTRWDSVVRFWDLAATEAKAGTDPDWTVGCKIGRAGKKYFIIDVQRFRETPETTESRIKQTAQADGMAVSVRIEKEGGASGKSLISHYVRDVLDKFDARGLPAGGDKVSRAHAFSAACERKDVILCPGEWVLTFIDELVGFPAVGHDDQVDAATGAYNALISEPEGWTQETLGKLLKRK